jgi:predicted hotdog family 3-hydroxylacyl-ACP dehydratase
MEDIRNISVLDLLPQRSPFVMIDRLVYFDRIKTVTEFMVRPENLFFDDGRLTASGLVENIAQTCAARMGYINLIRSDSVKLGFIGAIRNLLVYRTPIAGELLVTTIMVKEEVFRMTLVDAIVASNEEIVVKAEMKIALSDMESQN